VALALDGQAQAAIKTEANHFLHPRKDPGMSHFSATEHTAISSAAAVQLTDDERQPCEVWTRVMGYHRPVASFNTGKQGEHAERRFFAETHRGSSRNGC
jgi:hypothetical protein